MANQINLPSSYGGYVTSQALSSLGLSQTTTPGGGTGYKDASGTIYTFNGSSFVPLAAAAGGNAQTSNSSGSGTSNNAPPVQPTTQNVTYNGKSYTIPIDANPSQWLVQNNIAPATAFTPAQLGSQSGAAAMTAGVTSNPNQSVIGLPAMGPGTIGANVEALQEWLVANGYMTQQQMNTGPGIYGPQTTTAVASWQKAMGIDTQGNPGYFGPLSQNYLKGNYQEGNYVPGSGTVSPDGSFTATKSGDTGQPPSSSGGSAGAGGASGGSNGSGMIPGTSIPTTGNSNLDSILGSISGLIDSGKAVIPPGLQITPALTQQFLAWAHQVVDPQTQQLMAAESAGINNAIKNQVTQYQTSQGQAIQEFGANLASQDNNAGTSGTAFSGLHNVQDQNLANSTNRTLASLDANANYNISNALQTGGAALGAANAGSLNIPSLSTATVGVTGGNMSGGQGSSSNGQTLDFSYNPSIYTAGTIPSSQSTAVSNLAGNYLAQYGTLAGANSGKSISDLIGGVTGLPSGYQIPSSLT